MYGYDITVGTNLDDDTLFTLDIYMAVGYNYNYAVSQCLMAKKGTLQVMKTLFRILF